jgi:hypothetical protein
MTIHMSKVYDGMVNAYEKEIESSIKSGKDHFQITFAQFKLALKAQNITNNRITAREKWECLFLDGVAAPLFTSDISKANSAMIETRELLRASGFYADKKIKKNFSGVEVDA